MSNTKSINDKNTSTLQYTVTYDSKSTYTSHDSIGSSTSPLSQSSTPRRVISEASFKARARNNINY